WNNSSTYYSDVQYATINSDGSLGSFTATRSFTTGRYGFGMTTYNGYLYVYGGSASGNAYLSDSQYVPITGNGALGTWRTSASFSAGRNSGGSAAYNGYIYMTGGTASGATLPNTVLYAQID